MPLPLFATARTIHHEALDWATRASSNGGTISTTTIRAVSDFCAAADRGSFRSAIYRLNLFCGGNLSCALVPLYRGPTFGGTNYGNATDTNVNFVSGDYSETGATGGLKGNGTNKYLNTGYAANTLAANNTHLGIGMVTANTLTGFRAAIGAFDGTAQSLEINVRRSSGFGNYSSFFTRYNSSTDQFGDDVVTSTLAAGDLLAAWPKLYRNGTASGITATTSLNYPSAHSIFVFAESSAGTTPSNYTDARLGWYSIGATMTATQAGSYSSALAAFRAQIGR